MFAALSQYEGRFERLERQIAHNAMQLDMIARDVQTLRYPRKVRPPAEDMRVWEWVFDP